MVEATTALRATVRVLLAVVVIPLFQLIWIRLCTRSCLANLEYVTFCRMQRNLFILDLNEPILPLFCFSEPRIQTRPTLAALIWLNGCVRASKVISFFKIEHGCRASHWMATTEKMFKETHKK